MNERLLERRAKSEWDGTVPTALDWRLVGVIVCLAGLAASVNVPYGGFSVAAVAFVTLTGGAIGGHVYGERRLRRLTESILDRWQASGGHIQDVTRTNEGVRTAWTVHTSEGPITIRGFALSPRSRLTIEWQGVGEGTSVSDLDGRLESFADEWYREIFGTR